MYFDYQEFTRTTAIYPKDRAIEYLVAGLCSEAGEVAGKYKKYIRGDCDSETYEGQMLGELGDVLWYVVRLADEMNYSLDDVIRFNQFKLIQRQGQDKLQGMAMIDRFMSKLRLFYLIENANIIDTINLCKSDLDALNSFFTAERRTALEHWEYLPIDTRHDYSDFAFLFVEDLKFIEFAMVLPKYIYRLLKDFSFNKKFDVVHTSATNFAVMVIGRVMVDAFSDDKDKEDVDDAS